MSQSFLSKEKLFKFSLLYEIVNRGTKLIAIQYLRTIQEKMSYLGTKLMIYSTVDVNCPVF